MNARRRFALRLNRNTWFSIGCALLTWVLGSSRFSLVYAFPAGFEEYYILGNETQALAMFERIQNNAGTWTQISSEITVVATADHQVIYYDHWEDGYEADILHPTQDSTEVYGDDIPSGDVLRAGDIIHLNSDGGTDIHQLITIPRDREVLRYDSSDRLTSLGGPINIVHALVPSQTPWIGGAWEIYPVGAWGEAYMYTIPVGEDLYDGTSGYWSDFQHVWLVIQALEDNTTVHIDNGSSSISVQMNQGQSYCSAGFLDASTVGIPAIRVNAGTTVLANKSIQGGLVTGRETNQTRFYTLIPDSALGTEYAVPVPSTTTGEPAELFVYNPTQRAAQITAYDADTRSGTTFDLAPATAVAYRDPDAAGHLVPLFSSVHLHTDIPVWTWVSESTGVTSYDWGFSLIPSRYAGQDYYVSWAPATDGIVNNASPVWIASLRDNTTFRVDYSSPTVDGVPDEQFVLDALQVRRVYDPTDGDNTGMRIQADKPFMAAWGVDPSTGDSSQALDLGYLVPPLNGEWLDPVLTLHKTPETQTLPPTGGTASFALRAQAGGHAVSGVDITDTLPISWTYVTGSATVTYPDGSTASLEPTVLSQTLSWPLSVALAPLQSLTLTYQAQISIPAGLAPTVYDDLESGGYAGGSGWSGPWTEDESLCSTNCVENTTASTHGPPHSGSYHLVVSATGAASRTVDLSGFRRPTLRLWKRLDGLESGDSFALRLYDGLSWTTAETFTHHDTQDTYMGEQVDLSAYTGSPAFAFEIRGGAANSLDDLIYLDDVQVFDADVIQQNAAQATGTYGEQLFSSWDESNVLLGPLALTLDASDAHITPGNALTYTLHYTNNGPISLTNTLIQQVLPGDTSFVAASPGATYLAYAHTVMWGRSPTMTLLPGASGTFTAVVSVDPWAQDGQILSAVGYANSAQIIEAVSNPVETIVQAPCLTISKAAPFAANPGQIITYTIGYTNTGALTATGVLITDVIPLSTTYQLGTLAMDSGSGLTALTEIPDQDAGEIVDRTITLRPGAVPGQLAPGETGRVQFSVQISPTIDALDAIANYATVTRDHALPQRSTLALTEITDLTLEKSADREVVDPGTVIAYTILLYNADVPPETDVCVQDAIPAHTQYLTGTVTTPPGFAASYSTDGGQTWSYTEPTTPALLTDIRWCGLSIDGITTLAVGYYAQVEHPLSDTNVIIANQAVVRSLQTPAAYSNELLIPTVDLRISQTASSASVSPGQRLTVTIAYSNTGSAAIADLVITDPIPSHTTLAPNSISGGGISDGQVITWTTTLPAQGSGSVQFSVVVSDPVPAGIETIVNVVQLLGDQEFAATNTLTISLDANAELAVSKSNGLDAVHLGDRITYTIALSNTGRQGASGIVLTDTLPELVSFVPGSASSGGVYLSATHQVIWTFPQPLAGGSMTSRTVQGIVDLVVPVDVSQITNTVTVSDDGANGDTLLGNTAIDRDTLLRVPDLVIHKSDGGVTGAPGMVVIYTLSYTNAGDHGATGVWITDTVPAHASFDAAASTLGWSCADGAPAGTTCALATGDLPSGVGGSALFAVRVVRPLPAGVEALVNSAAIQDDGTNGADWHPDDNRASDSTPIVATPDLNVIKSAEVSSTSPGSSLYYTITVRNVGEQGATGIHLTDTLPDHTLFVQASQGGTLGDGVVAWPPFALEGNQWVTYSVTLLVDDPLPDGVDWITNTVSTMDDGANGADSNLLDNTFTDVLEVKYYPMLSIVPAGPASADVGDTVVLTFTVTQDAIGDGSPIRGVSVNDSLAGTTSYLEGDSNDNQRLEVGEQWIFVVSYTIPPTAPNPLIGQVTGTGTDRDNDEITSTATHSMSIGYHPAVRLIKDGPKTGHLGETIEYVLMIANVSYTPTSIRLSDDGDGSTLRHVVVTDSIALPVYQSGDDNDGLLEQGEVWIYRATHTIQDTDPDPLVNVAMVMAEDGNGNKLSDSDTHQLDVDYAAAIEIQHQGLAAGTVGDTVVLTFTVSHSASHSDGSAVSGVTIADTLLDDIAYVGGDEGDGLLERGERWLYSGHYTIVAGDAPLLSGTFAATGQDRDGDPVMASVVYHLQTVQELYQLFLPAVQNGPKVGNEATRLYIPAICK